MSNSIFMITEAGSLLPMNQTPFPQEASFQQLLEQYPELLSGDLIDPEEPRRWILVGPEAGIPDGTSASSRWSADHLFLDQNGIPTIVEVKRAENDEIRRRVVAQILDYGANAVVYWPPDLIRNRFEERAIKAGKDPSDELAGRLGIDPDKTDDFWNTVEINLRSGRIRLLIVADQIPRELRRIVEFLNAQMNPATILALELRHFANGSVKTLVPVVFGQTELAVQEKKVRSTSPNLTISSLFDSLRELVPEAALSVAEAIVHQAQADPDRFAVKPTGFSVFVELKSKHGQIIERFTIRRDGKLEFYLDDRYLLPPFTDPQMKQVLRDRIASIEGVKLSGAPKYPQSALENLTPKSLEGFRSLFDWVYSEVSAAEGQQSDG